MFIWYWSLGNSLTPSRRRLIYSVLINWPPSFLELSYIYVGSILLTNPQTSVVHVAITWKVPVLLRTCPTKWHHTWQSAPLMSHLSLSLSWLHWLSSYICLVCCSCNFVADCSPQFIGINLSHSYSYRASSHIFFTQYYCLSSACRKSKKQCYIDLKRTMLTHASFHAGTCHLDTYSCMFSWKNTTVCNLYKKEKLKLCYTANRVRPLLILWTVNLSFLRRLNTFIF